MHFDICKERSMTQQKLQEDEQTHSQITENCEDQWINEDAKQTKQSAVSKVHKAN